MVATDAHGLRDFASDVIQADKGLADMGSYEFGCNELQCLDSTLHVVDSVSPVDDQAIHAVSISLSAQSEPAFAVRALLSVEMKHVLIPPASDGHGRKLSF